MSPEFRVARSPSVKNGKFTLKKGKKAEKHLLENGKNPENCIISPILMAKNIFVLLHILPSICFNRVSISKYSGTTRERQMDNCPFYLEVCPSKFLSEGSC